MDFVVSVVWDLYFRSGSIQSAWSDDATIFHNLFREHTPSVYLSWLFSPDDPAEIFSEAREYERNVVGGDATLEVFSPDGWKQTLRPDGTLERSWYAADIAGGEEDIPELFMTRVNRQSVAILPAGQDLLLTETSDGSGPIDIYSVYCDVLAPQEKSGFRMSVEGGDGGILHGQPPAGGIPASDDDGERRCGFAERDRHDR